MELNQPMIDTAQRKWRHLRHLSLWEKVFLTITMITIVDEVMLSVIQFTVANSWSSDVIISIAVFINIVFCLVYAIEGVLTTRPPQLLILSCTLIFLSLLLIGNYITGHHDIIKLVQMVFVLIGTSALLIPGLYYAFNYQHTKRLVTLTVGESETYQMEIMYLMTSRDLFLLIIQTGTCAIILTSLYNRDTEDMVFIFIGFPYLVIWSIFGYYMLKKESVLGTRIVFGLCTLGIALMIYSMIYAGRNVDTIPGIVFGIILSVIAYAIAVICLIICAARLYKRFGSGMAEIIN